MRRGHSAWSEETGRGQRLQTMAPFTWSPGDLCSYWQPSSGRYWLASEPSLVLAQETFPRGRRGSRDTALSLGELSNLQHLMLRLSGVEEV